MNDKIYNFLYKYFGVYKTRIKLFFFLAAIYIISILLLMFKIGPLLAYIIAPIFMIENVLMVIFDVESFERKHRGGPNEN